MYGVVLGGGGTRGSYQIGVWKALKELNIPISAIVGTSIGSINGALMVQDDYDICEKLWLDLDFYKCFELPENKLIYKDKLTLKDIPYLMNKIIICKGLDSSPLRNILESYIDEDRIRKSKVEFGMVTFSLTNLKPLEVFKEDIPHGELINFLMASSCFPGFKQAEIKGERFIDGGIYNNIPSDMIFNKNITSIVTVDIHGPGIVRKVSKKDIEVIKIECSDDLGPIFNFEKELIRRNMKMGYYDTLRAFNKVNGNYYYFNNNSSYNFTLLKPLSDDEFIILKSSLGYSKKAGDKLILMRVIRELSNFTKKIPDGNTTIFSSLEITAQVLGLERYNIYHYDELLQLIIEKITNSNFNYKSHFKTLLNIDEAQLFQLNSDLLRVDDKIINIRRTLALYNPKYYIAYMFISIIKQRINNT